MRLAGSDPREFVAFVQKHFTHLVDLNADAPGGKRRQPIASLPDVVAYLERQERSHTDIIVYSASTGRDA
jgi:hypothetical protein